jgi:hypothetical protein
MSDYLLTSEVPSWSAAAGLCPGEPFAEQPAAAFCSGVLVDWDLVLTAGHCLRALPLDRFVVVFGYYYEQPEELNFGADDVFEPLEIVSERLDPPGVEPRLDYAWLRLKHPARSPRRPAPGVAAASPRLTGEPLVAISAGGGVPMKLDSGSWLLDPHAPTLDYFTTNTDTSGASSGGGAFDPDGVLLGILARGAPDFLETPEGCATTAYNEDDGAQEEYTYFHRALAGLCEDAPSASSLCRPACGEPCEALESNPTPPSVAAGCTMAPPTTSHPSLGFVIALGGAFLSRRRPPLPHRRRPHPATPDGKLAYHVYIARPGTVLAVQEPQIIADNAME